MCSPELAKGLCCICFGTVIEENRHPAYSDLHRGRCAILAGIVDPAHEDEADLLIGYLHAQEHGSTERAAALGDYYAFVDRVAVEDYSEDIRGPE